MNNLLVGKVAVVTGCGTALGESVAKALASHGAKVLLNGSPTDPLPAIVEEIQYYSGTAAFYPIPATDGDRVVRCLDRAIREYERLDCVIALDPAGAEALLTEAVRYLQPSHGSLVASVSTHDQILHHRMTALIGELALAQAPNGVRANCVAVGDFDHAGLFTAGASAVADETPMGRLATASEIAGPFVYLASDLSCYVTGTLLRVDGGLGAMQGATAPSRAARSA